MRKFIVGFLIGLFLNLIGGAFLINNKDDHFVRGYFSGLISGTIIMFVVMVITKKMEISQDTNLN